MRILICGDRNYQNKEKIKQCLQDVMKEFNIDNNWEHNYIIHGCAKGADTIGGEVGKELDFDIIEYPANWDEYGKSAGPKRNYQMLIEGKPDLVLAFHPDIKNSKGTKHIVSISKEASKLVRVFT